METNKTNGGYFLKGLSIGSLLGGLAGILFPPKSGKDLRSELKKKGSEAFDEEKRLYSETKTKAKTILDDAKHRAEELKKEADRQLSEARQRTKNIMACIKEKPSEVNPSAPRPEGQGLLRVEPERRFPTSSSKTGLGAAEWVNKYAEETTGEA